MDNILNTGSVSLARVLLIFYIIIASNFTGNLMGKQFKNFLEENRIAQHIIAFIMMLVLIIIVGNVSNIKKALVYSILGYLWFIFTTKMDIQWNLIIIFALLTIFLYENNMIEKETQSQLDTNLNEDDINNIKNHHSDIKTYVVVGVVIVTLIGMYLYINKKEGQYGGGKFDIMRFFLY